MTLVLPLLRFLRISDSRPNVEGMLPSCASIDIYGVCVLLKVI